MLKIVVLIATLFLAACRPKTTPLPIATPVPAQPTATSTPVPSTPTPAPVIHVVQPGESLSGIAFEYKLPVEALAEANGIQDPNVIQVGQKLVIPGPTSEPTATVPPTETPTPDIPPKFEIIDVIGRGAPATETVILVNQGPGISIGGWTLRDAQGNAFVFPELYLNSGTEVRIHTGVGENGPLHLYWNRDTAVWEEEGDSVILADDRGVVHASKLLD